MDKKAIMQAIDNEIEWSKDNKNQEVNKVTVEQAEWFVKGLQQAKTLIDMVYIE